MSNPEDIRMPQPGEGWRHYKGGYLSLYEIVGVGRDETGDAVVIYKPYGWTLAQTAPLYTRKLGSFLAEIDLGIRQISGEKERRQRFSFEREAAC